MRAQPILIASTMALAAALGLASGAPAAALYTTGAHTTPVAVGSSAGATNTTPWVLTSATTTLMVCSSSTLSLTLDQNSGGTVVGTFVSGFFAGCSPLPPTGLFTTPWKLTVDGAPTATGGITRWTASLTPIVFSLAGGTYSGNIETGLTARQTGAGGGMCMDFNDAGSFSGPLTSNGRLDISYCFEGAAASWSLT